MPHWRVAAHQFTAGKKREGRKSQQMGAQSAVRTKPSGVTGADAPSTDLIETWVLFMVDEQTYALQLHEVERIVRAVEVKRLPEVPSHIRGVVNVQGRVLPVVDLRARFGERSRPIALDDHFIIARTPTLSLILAADSALGSWEVSGTVAPRENGAPRCVRKVAPLEIGVVYALDLEQVLFGEESPADSELARVLRELQTE
jgi:purine-binding chemotaxis protein CheW